MARNFLLGSGRSTLKEAGLLITIIAEIVRIFSKAFNLLVAFYANRRQVLIR